MSLQCHGANVNFEHKGGSYSPDGEGTQQARIYLLHSNEYYLQYLRNSSDSATSDPTTFFAPIVT